MAAFAARAAAIWLAVSVPAALAAGRVLRWANPDPLDDIRATHQRCRQLLAEAHQLADQAGLAKERS